MFKSLLSNFTSDCYLCGCQSQPLILTEQRNKKNAPIICDECHQRLPIAKRACQTCGLPLIVSTNLNDSSLIESLASCGECLKNSPPYDQTLSAFHYETPINEMITKLKYSAQFQCLPLLTDYLVAKIQQHYLLNDLSMNLSKNTFKRLPSLIIPVPLHPKKRQARGFNQSQLIATKLAKSLNIKVNTNGVIRIKNTNAQSGLDSVERKSNVKGAFKININLPAHIALVDDVVTTGTTVSELAIQARLHGATQIDIWCLARAYAL